MRFMPNTTRVKIGDRITVSGSPATIVGFSRDRVRVKFEDPGRFPLFDTTGAYAVRFEGAR